ncbi:hypothetical protein [Brunnivagina elsteri]|nr:hypothetical protein [Calothrix elsteri]
MRREQDSKNSEKLANDKDQSKYIKKNLSRLNKNTENDDTDPPGG